MHQNWPLEIMCYLQNCTSIKYHSNRENYNREKVWAPKLTFERDACCLCICTSIRHCSNWEKYNWEKVYAPPLEGMCVIYGTVLALGIMIAIGKSIIGRKLMHKNWPLEGIHVIYKTVLALGIIAIRNIIIGRKFKHHLWKECISIKYCSNREKYIWENV